MNEAETSDERTWAMACHFSALAALLCIPFGNILGPLIVWMIKKDEYPLVEKNGKNDLNFQIFIAIYAVALGVIVAVLYGIIALISFIIPFLGFLSLLVTILSVLLGAALAISGLGLAVIAGLKVKDGETYEYPFSLQLIK